MSGSATVTDFIEELRWRGLLHQCTDEAGLHKHLAGGRRLGYAGFDPTADSLTIGNLVPIMLLIHLQRAGHTPVVLMGGGTGLIGDPSGKSAERALQTREQVEANVASQRRIFERLLGFGGENGARIVNNLDWLENLSYIDALRDVGKHFSVNVMMQKDSVRERLHNREQGISYTEFSYQILQAYDFGRLHEDSGVTLQIGGSDQWGNIVAGVDYTRRVGGGEVFGLTAPLVTRADGGKFGKTEQGAIWLTADRTSPYQFHQWCLNASDEDAVRFLKLFTLLEREEIESIASEHEAQPARRVAQQRLADEMTRLVHGDDQQRRARDAGRALFSGDVAGLDERTLEEVFAETPHSEHAKAELEGEGAALLDVLVQTPLASSKREAREFLSNGAVSVNGEKAGPDRRLTAADLLHGKVVLLRRGKKNWHVTRWA